MEICVHPLTLLAAALAVRFGLSAELLATMAGLSVHELAHLIAARRLGVPVTRLDLLPFGGAAQLGNLYALGRGRLIAVALAGPLGNLLMTLAAASMGWAGWLKLEAAALLVRANLALMLFNLLPALPLDGGRVLYAALEPVAGEKRAMDIGILFGALLAAALLACAGYGLLKGGRLNLTMLLAAVFILASALKERSARRESASAALAGAMRRIDRPHRLRLIAVDTETPLLQAARCFRSGEEALYAVYARGKLSGFLDQATLLGALTGKDPMPGETVGGCDLLSPELRRGRTTV